MFKYYYLHKNFYYFITFVIILFVLSYAFNALFIIAKLLLLAFVVTTIFESFSLKKASNSFDLNRDVGEKLSLGDPQFINYQIENSNDQTFQFILFDELPFQLQERSSIEDSEINPNGSTSISHPIIPLERGLYSFGNSSLYIYKKRFNLLSYRKIINNAQDIKVYPSIIQMKKFELQVFSKSAYLAGVRQSRRIGESDEFEHIRSYVYGDNIKSINWKATSRQSQLKVNQFQTTRSQSIYCIVDKGRAMKMPFFGMTLLDHAINSALVLSNIILKKYDKVGLITFSDKIGTMMAAKSIDGQLDKISSHLYNQKTNFKESNFELLYYAMRQQVTRRSILLFYTNFEHQVDLDRHLPYLKLLSQKHLLIAVIFINTELLKASEMICETKSDIYLKTSAQSAIREKEEITYRLRTNGIQCILTKPEDLNINVINKYLEVKNKLMI